MNTLQVNRGRCLAVLMLAVGLGFIVLAVASTVTAQSSEAPDPLELYDENDNGTIDGDEAFQAIQDHFAGLIDQALTLKVLNLYRGATGGAGGQSSEPECDDYYDEYDTNSNNVIDKSEAITAVLDYLLHGIITKDKAIAVVVCYIIEATPSPTPTLTPGPAPTPPPTPGPAPAPAGLKATASTASSVTLSWDSVPGASHYHLERGPSSDGPWTSVNSAITGTNHTATGLTCNAAYYFTVRAHGDGSSYSETFGPPSSYVLKPTARCPQPPTPTNFTVSVDHHGPGGIVLRWTALPDEVTGYEVQRSVGSGSQSYSTIATLARTTGSHSDTALMDGTSYQYQVRAHNRGTDGAWATSGDSITFKAVSGEWGGKWVVLDYRTILIDWVIPESDRSSTHQYKLVVPADTGFQINATTARNGDQCNWSSPPSAETSWVDLGTSFYLVRCKLGTGSADIVVKKRPKSGTNRTESTAWTLQGVVKTVCSRSSLPGVDRRPGMTLSSWHNALLSRATA